MRIMCLLFVLLAPVVSHAQEKLIATEVSSPFGKIPWEVNSYSFGEECAYPNEAGKLIKWGRHLGEDCNIKGGTPVYASADGKISVAVDRVGVERNPRAGTDKDNRNWGGVVIQGVWNTDSEVFYILYGHIIPDPDLKKMVGKYVKRGHLLGVVAPALTRENGWWEDSHLHLQVCLDLDNAYPKVKMLSGYAKQEAPNRLEEHIAPSEFFKRFKAGITIAELMKK